MIDRQSIVAEAATWIDTPYRHQGRAKQVGVDCIGVAGMAALNCGVDGAREWRADPEMHNYGRTPDAAYLRAACARFLDPIAITAAGVADILIIAFLKQPQHFALISQLDPVYVIHAYLQRRRVVKQSLPIAKSRVIGAYRFRGVA